MKNCVQDNKSTKTKLIEINSIKIGKKERKKKQTNRKKTTEKKKRSTKVSEKQP
jgi:hypothetical protein